MPFRLCSLALYFSSLLIQVVKAIVSKELDVTNFSQSEHHPKTSDKHGIEWIFVIDTLNFCFWTPGNEF